ncbi:hypothetical protein NKDENANG_01382 [Candidatus Entotheonellaceae bacterium PAL068K]
MQEVRLKSFKLFDTQKNREVRPVRLLDQFSDPNKKFSEYQFALFPLQRLEWNRKYRVEIQYVLAGQIHEMKYEYRTRKLSHQSIKITRGNSTHWVPNHEQIAIYAPPTRTQPVLKEFRWRSSSNLKIETDWIDSNTLLVYMNGEVCDKATFEFAGDFNFFLKIAPPGVRNPTDSDCRSYIAKNLPGKVIDGKGERFFVASGGTYNADAGRKKRAQRYDKIC